jgi:hypothetical protein
MPRRHATRLRRLMNSAVPVHTATALAKDACACVCGALPSSVGWMRPLARLQGHASNVRSPAIHAAGTRTSRATKVVMMTITDTSGSSKFCRPTINATGTLRNSAARPSADRHAPPQGLSQHGRRQGLPNGSSHDRCPRYPLDGKHECSGTHVESCSRRKVRHIPICAPHDLIQL